MRVQDRSCAECDEGYQGTGGGSAERDRRVGKELCELQKKVDEYREREKRRKPTKFKLEE
ncbi:MAG TPA: hypothetical protein DIC52_06445 [Candidatus Latescibacteria bacterium]|nr:hypothetical protein [Candidatus Latescibacterota bacterium]